MANVVGLSETHEQNLRKLAAYLLALPEGYERFHMASFCGTSACALGHGPDAGIPRQSDDWMRYAAESFGLGSTAQHWVLHSWQWCFSPDWAKVDNTPHGAAKRILWMLENGVPDDAILQECGKASLCYAATAIEPPPSAAPPTPPSAPLPVAVLTGPYESVRRKKNHAPAASAGATL